MPRPKSEETRTIRVYTVDAADLTKRADDAGKRPADALREILRPKAEEAKEDTQLTPGATPPTTIPVSPWNPHKDAYQA